MNGATTLWSMFVSRAEVQSPLFVSPGRVRYRADEISWGEARRLVAEVAEGLAVGERHVLPAEPTAATLIHVLAAWSRGAIVDFDGALAPLAIGRSGVRRALDATSVDATAMALPGIGHAALAASSFELARRLALRPRDRVAVFGPLSRSVVPLLFAPLVVGGSLWLGARLEGALGEIAALQPSVIVAGPTAIAHLADELELRALARGPIRAALLARVRTMRRRAARALFGRHLRRVVGGDAATVRRLEGWGIDATSTPAGDESVRLHI